MLDLRPVRPQRKTKANSLSTGIQVYFWTFQICPGDVCWKPPAAVFHLSVVLEVPTGRVTGHPMVNASPRRLPQLITSRICPGDHWEVAVRRPSAGLCQGAGPRAGPVCVKPGY